jgi:hypothetical protein
MNQTLLLLFSLSCVLSAEKVYADTITLKDGRQISGLVQTGASGEIHVKAGSSVQVFAVVAVQSIAFDVPENFAPIPPPALPAAAPANITIPAGTEIAIRTIDRIDSKKADTYKEYAASLDDPVIVNGATVIPANANAFVKASDIHAPGVTRRASLSLTLVAVTINGQRVAVQTGKVDSQSGSQAKRAAATTLAGAAVGAGIGAKVAGGVGAAVGAGIGGVGGAIGGKMLSKGVEIAPETRFSYKLTQPVTVTYQGGGQ